MNEKIKFILYETDPNGKEKPISETLSGIVKFEEQDKEWIEVSTYWNNRSRFINIKKAWIVD